MQGKAGTAEQKTGKFSLLFQETQALLHVQAHLSGQEYKIISSQLLIQLLTY